MELSANMWHWNNMKFNFTLWTQNYVDCVPFFCIDSRQKIVFLNFRKTWSNKVNFQIFAGFDEIKWLCAITKYTIEKLIAKPQSA